MKRTLISIMAIFFACLTYILITSQKKPEKGKFYYAFNEKIFINEIPDKFVIKFKDSQKAKEVTELVKSRLSGEKMKYLNETTITVSLSGDIKTPAELLKDKTDDVELIKPAYKYQNQEMYYTNEILVEPNDGISINEVISKNGLTQQAKVKGGKFYSIIEIATAYDACDVANKIQESGMVKYSHPNFMIPLKKHQVLPNDTYFGNQYYLWNTGQVFNPVENHSGLAGADINAPWAWNTSLGNNAIIVAVIDAGVTANHTDLPNTRQLRLNGSNFVPGENANDPTTGLHENHGNACSGIIAATQNNNEGVTGIAPAVRIMPIKIFGDLADADENGIAAAIDFAWQNGAHVISNSWGASVDDPNFSPVIVQAINRAVTQGRGGLGSVVVFSASNTANHSLGNNGIVGFPGNVQINGVLTVGASDRNDQQADYSPSSDIASPNNQIIDIVAPSHRAYPPAFGGIAGEGFEVWTMDIPGNNGYNQWNDAGFPGTAPAFGEVLPTTGTNNLSYTGRMGGTSAACPQVAAVAALVLSVNNNLTQQQVFDIITQSAEDVGGYTYDANGWCPELGNGRLNACAALSRVPNLYQASGLDYLCTTHTYTVPGVPAGSTILNWVSSDPAIATINSSGLATRVGSGTVVFTATVSIPNRCGSAFPSKTVWAGVPQQPGPITVIMVDPTIGKIQVEIDPVPGAPASNSYNWYKNGVMVPGQHGTFAQISITRNLCGVSYNIEVEAINSCGTSPKRLKSVFVPCGGRYTLSPNPATNSTVTISLKQDGARLANDGFNEIKIYDWTGNLKKTRRYNNTKQASIDISELPNGSYFVEISDGTSKERQSLIIQR